MPYTKFYKSFHQTKNSCLISNRPEDTMFIEEAKDEKDVLILCPSCGKTVLNSHNKKIGECSLCQKKRLIKRMHLE
jgi:hypothetical protein